ncbi:MAG: MbtH family protein [Pseudonocardiaceae bacterium]
MSVDRSVGEGDDAVDVVYEVVMNHEEQYSIWPADQEIPAGWNAVGFRGSKPDALDHIEKVWTDITPLSVRQVMQP